MDEKEISSQIDKTKQVNENESKASVKSKKKARNKKIDLIEELKMEIASELGIVDQIEEKGWDSLSPSVSGKIGGKLSQKLRKMKKYNK